MDSIEFQNDVFLILLSLGMLALVGGGCIWIGVWCGRKLKEWVSK